jgi:hypothetical protein
METKYMTAEKFALFVKTYEESGKLPEKKIPCVACGEEVSMFHDNLRHRIAKFGSVTNLLSNFQCRACRKTEKAPAAPKKVKASKSKKPEVKEEITTVSFSPVKLIQSERNVMSFQDIAASKELTQEFTNGSCMQPHMFLNQGRSCKGCIFFDNCLCNCKQVK